MHSPELIQWPGNYHPECAPQTYCEINRCQINEQIEPDTTKSDRKNDLPDHSCANTASMLRHLTQSLTFDYYTGFFGGLKYRALECQCQSSNSGNLADAISLLGTFSSDRIVQQFQRFSIIIPYRIHQQCDRNRYNVATFIRLIDTEHHLQLEIINENIPRSNIPAHRPERC